MAGRGPAPKPADQHRRTTRDPDRPWNYAEGRGWQHGPTPKPPTGLTKPSKDAWNIWFDAWFAYFWTPDDLPGLRQMVRLYDQVERGEFQRHPELRLVMESFGVTPKGQQDRRWLPPKAEQEPATVTTPERWGNLRVADGA